jgi:hypothetical protein
MKRAGNKSAESPDDLKGEYAFDCSRAKKNRYADRLKGKAIAVVLDPDVAAAFPTSRAVNRTLRAVVEAVPRRSKGRATPRRRRPRKIT